MTRVDEKDCGTVGRMIFRVCISTGGLELVDVKMLMNCIMLVALFPHCC